MSLLFNKYSNINTIYKLTINIILLFTILLFWIDFSAFLASFMSLNSLLIVLKRSHNFSLSSFPFSAFFLLLQCLVIFGYFLPFSFSFFNFLINFFFFLIIESVTLYWFLFKSKLFISFKGIILRIRACLFKFFLVLINFKHKVKCAF